MLNLHLLECTVKGYDHISDLLLAKYGVITGCKYSGCEGLREIHISDLAAWCELLFYDLLDIGGDSPFYYATELYLNGKLVTDLVVPNNVTHIGAHTFEGYEKLKSVVLHNGIHTIHKSAFLNCTNLTDIKFSKTLNI